MSGSDESFVDSEPESVEETEGDCIVITTENRFIRSKKVVPEMSSDQFEVKKLSAFKGPYARIRRKGGLTINLGDFESVRVDVTVDLPCYLPDLDLADEYAENWIGERIRKAVLQARAERNRKKEAKGR